MQSGEDGGRLFHAHLRDAYEALEAGNREDAKRSIMAASSLDPYALAAAQWWTYFRAEAALADARESEPATGNSAGWSQNWRRSVEEGLRRLLRVPPFTKTAAVYSVTVLVIGSLVCVPLIPAPKPDPPPAHVLEIAPQPALLVPK